MCTWETEVETTEHFLLRCQFDSTQRLERFESLKKVEPNFISLSVKIKFLFHCMVLKPIIPKVPIKEFLKM